FSTVRIAQLISMTLHSRDHLSERSGNHDKVVPLGSAFVNHHRGQTNPRGEPRSVVQLFEASILKHIGLAERQSSARKKNGNTNASHGADGKFRLLCVNVLVSGLVCHAS